MLRSSRRPAGSCNSKHFRSSVTCLGKLPLLVSTWNRVAAPDSVSIDTRWQGFKGFFSGENLFFLAASGRGPVLMNAFGAIETLELDGELIVDTGHLVAFTGGIDYEVTKASDGWIASFLSGEGLVLRPGSPCGEEISCRGAAGGRAARAPVGDRGGGRRR